MRPAHATWPYITCTNAAQERAGALTALERAGRALGSMQAALEERGAAATDAGGGWGPGCAAPDFESERAARPLYRDPVLHLTARATLRERCSSLAGGGRANRSQPRPVLMLSCQNLTRSYEAHCAAALGGSHHPPSTAVAAERRAGARGPGLPRPRAAHTPRRRTQSPGPAACNGCRVQLST